MILQVWQERLSDDLIPGRSQPEERTIFRVKDIFLIVVLSLIGGTLIKLPQFIPLLDTEFFYSRNLALIVALLLTTYFFIRKSPRTKTVGSIFILFLGSAIFLNLLPEKPESQTIILSCLHIPFFFWSLLGAAFLAGRWRNLPGRMDYIRFNGDLLIHSTIFFIGGMVLAAITYQLFKLIGLDIEKWYIHYVGVYGSVAIPIVATAVIEKSASRRLKLAPVLARIFTPLFLITTIVYLGAMIIQGKSPYADRDFLIAFNILLVVVLCLCVFSISERTASRRKGLMDFMNMALVSVTLIIDLVALSAILFRLTSYGFTPNRIAVLGANLLVFCHLAGLIYHYLRYVRGERPFKRLENWISSYIPVYTTWSVIVAFGFPFFFRFK